MSIRLTDEAYPISTREHTPEGYLRVKSPVARVGVMDYLPKDVGQMPERLQGKPIIRIYRPMESISDEASLASYEDKPVTVRHPQSFVKAGNWKSYAVGMVKGNPEIRGEEVWVDLLITSADGLDYALKNGGDQLSPGYDAEIDWTPGTYLGQAYDGVQRNIRINHIALVKKARGGPTLKLQDERMKKTIKFNDVAIELDEDEAAKVSTFLASIEASLDTIKKMNESLKASNDMTEKELEDTKAELNDAKAQLTDEAIEERVSSRLTLLETARKINDKAEYKGLNTRKIKEAALQSFCDGLDDKSDEYIDAAFDIAAKKIEAKDTKKQELRDAANVQIVPASNDMYKGYVKRNQALFVGGK